MINNIDTQTSEAVNEIRVIKLVNTLATELGPILQSAISGQVVAGVPGQARPSGAAGQKSTTLRLVTIDAQGKRLLNSGILTDVNITPDSRTNSLVVSAPSESMPLIEALIQQLDQLPAAEAQIKVFTIVNGDADALANMLSMLFGQQAMMGLPAVRTGTQAGESALVQLRFAVDTRTNSIIATGSAGDLSVVEAILLRLDEAEVRGRQNIVYRLKNSPAMDVANAIAQLVQNEMMVEQSAGVVTPAELVQRQVFVVPEPVSNSLIVSATPRYFEEIRKVVEELDRRPPMVMIQVLIGEVSLNDIDEFGIELGLQDSILFDRSVLGDLLTTSTTSSQPGQPQVTTQTIVSATNTPGFNFNNQPLGNSGSTSALAHSDIVGTQGLSNFALGRANSTLGFGGLVLSASSDAVSVLLRALQECRRLEVLSRPQVMTLDNQPAFIQVGQRVPRIQATTITQTGTTNSVTLENVGLILGVTPRISPDGLVVMEIDAEKSAVGPEAEGVPISISTSGQVIRSPRIDTTTAQTTVSAMDGQTVILGGLLTKNTSTVTRKVPWLAEVPVLGHLFRYDAKTVSKTELLIVMTPHIVNNKEDNDLLKQTEASRMHWCMTDVINLHGDINARGRKDEWSDGETKTVYPDLQPGAETIPSPPPAPPLDQGVLPQQMLRQPEASPVKPQTQSSSGAMGFSPAGPGGPMLPGRAEQASAQSEGTQRAEAAAYDPIHGSPLGNPSPAVPSQSPAEQPAQSPATSEKLKSPLQGLFAR